MTIERLDHYLAIVTLAMPVVLTLAHLFRAVARRLYAYALTTTTTADDKAMTVILAIADWLDQVAKAIAHAASLGVLARRDDRDEEK